MSRFITTDKLKFTDNSELATAGAFGINYITNPGADSNISGATAYADAAGTSPIDGVGGSPTVTITRTTSSPLRGAASYLLTKDAANRQGQGVSYDFTIDSAQKGRSLSVLFDYIIGYITNSKNVMPMCNWR